MQSLKSKIEENHQHQGQETHLISEVAVTLLIYEAASSTFFYLFFLSFVFVFVTEMLFVSSFFSIHFASYGTHSVHDIHTNTHTNDDTTMGEITSWQFSYQNFYDSIFRQPNRCI